MGEEEPVATAMETFLESATALFTWVFNSLGTVITTITGNPILLVGLLISLVGFVIGIFKRLTNVV